MGPGLLEERFVLNPVLELRGDKKRAVLFHTDPVECGRNPFTKFLHPRIAIFLGLFDGSLQLGEVITLWARMTRRGYEDALREAIKILQDQRDLDEEPLLPVTRAGRRRRGSNAADLLVGASEVDLASTRCYFPIGYIHDVCYRCATRCAYCYSELPNRKGSLLVLSRLREIVAEANQLGIPRVGMSGGDPFCHPQIFELLGIYNEAGILVDLPTKIPLDENQLCRLRDMPLVRLQLSIDGIEPNVNDWLVGAKGHTERILKTLYLMRDVGLQFSVNAVLTSYNYKQAADLVPFLMENFGQQIRRISLSPYGRSIYRHKDEFFLSAAALQYLEDTVASYRQQYPGQRINLGGAPAQPPGDLAERRKQYDNRALCTANRSDFVLLPDGQVTVCEELYYHPAFLIGDLRTQSVMEMWDGPLAKALAQPDQTKIKDGPCATCPEFNSCHTIRGRCYKRALQAYGYSQPHWPDPSCPYAPQGQVC